MELVISSCIRGYHMYGEVWTAVLGEQFYCEREVGNIVDRYAVAVKNNAGTIVGHLPQKISWLCSIFLTGRGTITATVTGLRRYSSDLAQRRLEIPCDLKYCGEQKKISKLKRFYINRNNRISSVSSILYTSNHLRGKTFAIHH